MAEFIIVRLAATLSLGGAADRVVSLGESAVNVAFWHDGFL